MFSNPPVWVVWGFVYTLWRQKWEKPQGALKSLNQVSLPKFLINAGPTFLCSLAFGQGLFD